MLHRCLTTSPRRRGLTADFSRLNGLLLVTIYRAAFDTAARLRRGNKAAELGVQSGKAPPLPLSGLIAVQASADNPLPMTIFPFINRRDTSESRARGFGPKADSEAVSSAYERLWAAGDDKAVAVFTLVVEAVIQSDLQFVSPQLSNDAGVPLVEHEANHRALALVLKNEWGQLPQG